MVSPLLEQALTKVTMWYCCNCRKQGYAANGPTQECVEFGCGHRRCDNCPKETREVRAAPGSASSSIPSGSSNPSTRPQVRYSSHFTPYFAEYPRHGSVGRRVLEQAPTKSVVWICCECGMYYNADGPTEACVVPGCGHAKSVCCKRETSDVAAAPGSASSSASSGSSSSSSSSAASSSPSVSTPARSSRARRAPGSDWY
ncbi:hypothetical protein VTJ49DRAFT_4147 [Mycothermus thermophilus]|uniref:RING-type domain-containing protein n=1 Tax=Humicola insolens TaxID=85995 RepID=A0ABR3VM96_HUMIN